MVASLPTENIRDKVIYFVPKTDSEQQDAYDEFIYINDNWEHIGTTEVDLSNYYTRTNIDILTRVSIANVVLPKRDNYK